MIDSDDWSGDGRTGGRPGGAPWRRALDVLDDYDRGALTEALADDLVNELAGLGPRARRPRRAPLRPGPQPSRPSSPSSPSAPLNRPRLILVPGTV